MVNKTKLHWYLTLEDFLGIRNEFKDGMLLNSFEATRQSIQSKTQATSVFTHELNISSMKGALDFVLLRATPKLLNYVCKGKTVSEMSDGEMLDASRRYKHFDSLYSLFNNLLYWETLEPDADGFVLRGMVYEVPSNDIFTVERIEKPNGKTELTVARESIQNDIFDNINLNRLKRCERCNDYFYANKDDVRIKFCSLRCANAASQESFQKNNKSKVK